jgi:hypothetical protein
MKEMRGVRLAVIIDMLLLIKATTTMPPRPPDSVVSNGYRNCLHIVFLNYF